MAFRCFGEAKDEGREGGGEAATPVAKPQMGAAGAAMPNMIEVVSVG